MTPNKSKLILNECKSLFVVIYHLCLYSENVYFACFPRTYLHVITTMCSARNNHKKSRSSLTKCNCNLVSVDVLQDTRYKIQDFLFQTNCP